MKKLTLMGVLALLCLYGNAQSPPIQPLQVGDTVPDLWFTQVRNYEQDTLRLSHFGDKLIILDFWATTCGSCIEAMPKLQQLQQQHNSWLQIVLVNVYEFDTPERIEKFLGGVVTSQQYTLSLPLAFQQQHYLPYFPHKFIPHYVWIKNNRVLAITGAGEITYGKLQQAAKNNLAGIVMKQDNLVFDRTESFLGETNKAFITSRYGSLLTSYIDGVGTASGFYINREQEYTRFYQLNGGLRSLLRIAYGSLLNKPDNLLLHATTKKPFFKPDNLARLSSDSFCYEIILPVVEKGALLEPIQQDILRYWNIKADEQLLDTECLQLIGYHPQRWLPYVEEETVLITSVRQLLHFLNSCEALEGVAVVVKEHWPVVGLGLHVPLHFRSTATRGEIITFLQQQGFEMESITAKFPYTLIYQY